MKIITRSVCASLLYFMTVTLLLSCAPPKIDENSTDSLIFDLNANQSKWLQQNISNYSFSIHKECNCPSDLTSPIQVDIDDAGDEEEQTTVDESASKLKSKARTFSTPTAPSYFSTPTLTMDSYFADLRRAIQAGQIRSVQYDTQYGYPRTIFVSASPQTRAADLQVHALDFRAQQVNPLATSTILVGTHSFNSAQQRHWIITDDGRWFEFRTILSLVIPMNQNERVQVVGNWVVDGATGQLILEVTQFTPVIPNTIQTTIRGNLILGAQATGLINTYLLINESGSTINLNVPSTLDPQLRILVGSRVDLTGSWDAIQSRFTVSRIEINQVSSIQLTGRLTTFMPSVGTGLNTRYALIENNGQARILVIPDNLVAEANRLVSINAQVTISGLRVASASGGWYIDVRELRVIQNILTTVQVTGKIIEELLYGGNAVIRIFKIQTDVGSVVTVAFRGNVGNIPSGTYAIGTRIQVTGNWNINGIYLVPGPLLEGDISTLVILSTATSTATFSGYIIEVGSPYSAINCSTRQLTYRILDDASQVLSLQLGASSTTDATGPGGNYRIGDRVGITGIQNGTSIQVQSMRTLPPPFAPITSQKAIAGTIVSANFPCAQNYGTAVMQTDNGQYVTLAISQNTYYGFLNPISSSSVGMREQAAGIFSNDGLTALVLESAVLSMQPESTIRGTITSEAPSNSQFVKNYYVATDSVGPFEVSIYTPGTLIQPGLTLTIGKRVELSGVYLPTGALRFAAFRVSVAQETSTGISDLRIASMKMVNTDVQIIVSSNTTTFYIGANPWTLFIGTERIFSNSVNNNQITFILPVAKFNSIPDGSLILFGGYGTPSSPTGQLLGTLNKSLVDQTTNIRVTEMKTIGSNVQITITNADLFYVGANPWILSIGTYEFFGQYSGPLTQLIFTIPKTTIDIIPDGTEMFLRYGISSTEVKQVGFLYKQLIGTG